MSSAVDPTSDARPIHAAATPSSSLFAWLTLRAPGWVLVAIVLGACARLSGVGLGWFMVDQVRDAFIATSIAAGTSFPMVGPQSAQSSISITGPLYYYLIAIPYALSPDPLVASWCSALLSVATVYLVYRLGAERFDRRVGIVAALLYATYPFAVINGLAVWNPGLLPVFCVAFVLTMWRYCVTAEPWQLAATLVLLAFALNVHLTSGPLLLLLPLAWIIYRPRVRPWPALLGIAGSMLFWAPYALNEARNGFAGLRGGLRWAAAGTVPEFLPVAWRALVDPFLLPARLRLPFATSDGAAEALVRFNAVQMVEATLFLAGLGLCACRAVAAEDRRPYALLLAWFAVPFVPISFTSTGVLWYYFDVLYPLHCLVVAVLASHVIALAFPDQAAAHSPLFRRPRVVAAALVMSAIGIILAAQSWYLNDFFAETRRWGALRATGDLRLDVRQDPPVRQETMTLAAKRALARAFASELGADHSQLESRAHGASYVHFREDRGFLLTKVPHAAPPAPAAPSTHYVILRDDFPVRPSLPPTVRTGAYGIWAYTPLVQDTWSVSTRPEPGWSAPELATSGWRSVTLPARVGPDMSVYRLIPYTAWGAHPVVFRGAMLGPGKATNLWVIISLREKSAHRIAAMFVNGVEVAPAHAIALSTIETSTQELLFDVSGVVRPGHNALAFLVEGEDREFDLDVHELEGAPSAGVQFQRPLRPDLP